MSYCVNCGVELDRAQKACPLCDTVVINPNAQELDQTETAFAQARDEKKKTNRGFWIKFTSITATVPLVVSILTNLLSDKRLSWSVFVIAGVFIIWGICTAPFLFRRFTYTKMLIAHFAAVAIGLGVIQYVLPEYPWYYNFALPLTVFCLLFWLAALFLTKKKVLKGLRIAAAFFVFVSMLLVLIESLIELNLLGTVVLSWCWLAVAPCISIAALLLLLDSNEHFKQEFAKRFHL